ncbi:hypothetical protein [Micrococcus sp.]|uniref:hypothetical protein n=1 Tax=Micrococcus sp. TaxID=1271 RepID=UPI002A9209B3|nr:hypothetical protein [Micrococcus sp.]MDY6054268.1 hypothetical protein [Micrococcus sp.]
MSRPRASRTAALAAVGVTGALALTGCGIIESITGPEPAERVRIATDRLAEATEQSSTVRITATEAQLEDLARGPENDRLSDQEYADVKPFLDRLRESTFTTQATSTREGVPVADAQTPADSDSAAAWAISGDRMVELVEIGDHELYLRADVLEVLRRTGTTDARRLADDLQSQIASTPSELQWVVDLISGRWIGFDKALTTQFREEAQRQAHVDAEALTPEERDRLRASILENSDVTDLGGNRYEVKVHVKRVVEANRDLVDKLLQAQAEAEAIPSREASTVDDLLPRLNDNTFDVIQEIDGETIKAVEVDPLQTADLVAPPEDAAQKDLDVLQHLRDSQLPMRVEYGDAVDMITVPEGATRITEEDLNSVAGGSATL